MRAGVVPTVNLQDWNGIPVYAVDFGKGVRAAFTTRRGGVSTGPYSSLNLGAMVGDRPDRVQENRRRVAQAMGRKVSNLVTADQVHGAQALLISSLDGLPAGLVGNPVAGQGDIMVTNTAGPLLAVLVADCVPVLMYDAQHRAVAAVHAGWRGTAAGAVARALEFMGEQFGTRPGAMSAVIGPSIGPCCYEVDDVVIEPISRRFDQPGRLMKRTRPGHALLDLWEANRQLLLHAGVLEQFIVVSGLCTACDTERFFSHRAEQGVTGRIAALITLE